MDTFIAKPTDITRKWYHIDANGQILGRMAVLIATMLRGKNKPYFAPNMDCGDFIIVTNAEKIEVTGKKAEQKEYIHHTTYPGGLRTRTYKLMLSKHPERIIEEAVWGMLPHNRLGRRLIRKLKVYKGNEHPHIAQKPEELVVNFRKR